MWRGGKEEVSVAQQREGGECYAPGRGECCAGEEEVSVTRWGGGGECDAPGGCGTPGRRR